jgi:hypothetical protein
LWPGGAEQYLRVYIKMEESMSCESSMLPRIKTGERKWADESGEQLGTVEKLVLVVAAVVIAFGTMFLPVVLLHFR